MNDAIKARAGIAAEINGISATEYYQTLMLRCYLSNGMNHDQAFCKVQSKLNLFKGQESEILAITLIVYDISLDEIMPVKFVPQKSVPSAVSSEGLPLERMQMREERDIWIPDDEDAGIAAKPRWADLSSDEESRSHIVAADDVYSRAANDAPEGMQGAGSTFMIHQNSSVSTMPSLCESWLKDISLLLRGYDGRLLYRNVPSLSPATQQKIIAKANVERIAYLNWKRDQNMHEFPQQISKMEMRQILATVFEQLAHEDAGIQDLHRQWQATMQKSLRKGKGSAKRHTEQWWSMHGEDCVCSATVSPRLEFQEKKSAILIAQRFISVLQGGVAKAEKNVVSVAR